MLRKCRKLLLSFWTTNLALVALFTLAAGSNAQEILKPHAPPILHSFLDSANVYPESVTVDQSSGTFFVGSVKEGTIYKGKVSTAGSPAAVTGTQPPVLPFWITQIRERIVTALPLQSIWTDEEQLEATRERYLTPTELTEMLRIHPVEFIVAEIGAPLKRISVDKCYEFWEREVKRHLLSPHGKTDRSKLADEYGYLASEWSGQTEVPIVLLEKIH